MHFYIVRLYSQVSHLPLSPQDRSKRSTRHICSLARGLCEVRDEGHTDVAKGAKKYQKFFVDTFSISIFECKSKNGFVILPSI
jgi:hypothetical protein